VVLSRNPDRLKKLVDRGWIPFASDDGLRKATPWTDDYVNILWPLWESINERWASFRFADWWK
jgi:hypothetical protein